MRSSLSMLPVLLCLVAIGCASAPPPCPYWRYQLEPVRDTLGRIERYALDVRCTSQKPDWPNG